MRNKRSHKLKREYTKQCGLNYINNYGKIIKRKRKNPNSA